MSEKIPPNEEKMPAQPAQQPPQTEALVGQAEQYEKELSPETIEKIMEKVRDINAEGVAYSIIGGSRTTGTRGGEGENSLYSLQRVLREGLLGGEGMGYRGPERWAKDARAREFTRVHFNIVGRSQEGEKIPQSYRWHAGAIAPIFSLAPFREGSPGSQFNNQKFRYPTEVVEIMKKENALLPLYDAAGDLLWPKRMSYEEVKKFVAEREEEKKEAKKES